MARERPFIDGGESPRRYSDVAVSPYEDYVAPAEGLERATDRAPLAAEHSLPAYANRGYAHLKGGR